MLGDAAAARCPAPAHPAGFDGVAQSVSAAISWCDVFRLRRRVFDCRLQPAGSRCVQSERPRCAKMSPPKQVIVSGDFDDLKSCDLRFLEEAAKLGGLSVLLWPDVMLQKLHGKAPKFPLAERRYFLN